MIFLRFAGTGGCEVRVVHCICCGSGNDRALASNCHIHQQYQSTSRVPACGRKGGYILRIIALRNQMLMGLHCRVKHLIVKSLGIPTLKLVWNCLKSSFKIIVKPSSGQLCPVLTKGFSCAAKCAIFCIVCCEGSCRGVVYLLNGIEMRCDLLTLLLVSYWASLILCRRRNFVQRC